MKFICEYCGKQFQTEEDCVKHENNHKDEERSRAEKESERLKSSENINELYKQYYNALVEHYKKFNEYAPSSNKIPGDNFWRILF